MMKILLTCFALVFSCTIIAQTGTDSLLRYDKAIKYLAENKEELKNQWLSLFEGSAKREYKRRLGKEVNYKVSPIICFLQILPFSDEIKHLDSIAFHTNEELIEPRVYLSRYGFASFISSHLLGEGLTDTLGFVQSGTFIINFSKPINNYIIAEISGNPGRLKQCSVKILGRTMWILFMFSKYEKLTKVYYTYVDH